ncbi:type II 3-dehydroquinate dehydratase [Mesorhizobium sp. AR07]|uniref:type II 3-dehydroquinate dehydratase n=1 Tax=Mesorhizobium sp. AR07 TaxID=2865838 RepID=UPI00215FB748|nr:type II 3-dehydroquinate dehydratase [Mesorhizobium sp. AR07]UVK41838.1 type II 3-dehydroquinate dehydratase [Mesorhizobium sp. AR07]
MSDTLKIDVLNGPNTNLYGLDPSGLYGRLTLPDIERLCRDRAQQSGASLRFRQSSNEGTLIDWIHDARREADGLVINGGSLSYTSLGLMDALVGFSGPVFQVHVSNVFKREPIRHHSFISHVISGCLIGLGPAGYEFAIEAIIRHFKEI